MMWRYLPLILVLGWYAHQSQGYVRVFQSNEVLWAHAAQMAPGKPRVASSYAGALLEAEKGDEAMRQYALAQRLTYLPHVPAYDARETRETIQATMTALLKAEILVRK